MRRPMAWPARFAKQGIRAFFSQDYRAFEQHLRWLNPDLIVLDLEDDDFFGQFVTGSYADFAPTIHLVSQVANRPRAFAAGATDCIVKPVLAEALQARVNAHLQLHLIRKQLNLRNTQLATTLGIGAMRRCMTFLRIKSSPA